MRLFFSKYHGTGNDFVMIDNRRQGFVPAQATVAALCRRRTGIGADGLILISAHDKYDFTMRYFNADGQESTMCGNGGRCAIAFAHAQGLCGKKTRFLAVDGEHEGVIEEGLVRLKMQDVTGITPQENGYFLDTGSPHFVLFTEDVENFPVSRRGREIRNSELFQPEGTNVNFTGIVDDSTLFNRTYERGVEEETLSCGTGSVAAALVFADTRQNVSTPVTVRTPGGTLRVSFVKKGTGHYGDIWLQGPAVHVFNGSTIIHDKNP